MDWIGSLKGILAFITKQKATTLVITVLVAIVFLQRACPVKEYVTEYQDKIVLDTVVEYVYETDTLTVEKSILVHDTITEVEYRDVPADVDTMAILSDYYAVKTFGDTLVDNDDLFAYMRSEVSQNQLEHVSLDYSIKRPIEVVNTTNVLNPVKNILYVDGELGGNTGQFNASIGLSLINKKKQKYSFRYDLMHKTYHIGMGFKIFEYGKSK